MGTTTGVQFDSRRIVCRGRSRRQLFCTCRGPGRVRMFLAATLLVIELTGLSLVAAAPTAVGAAPQHSLAAPAAGVAAP